MIVLPSVTAMCPTYGRVGLLEESVESFLRQDYGGHRELVIVNDLPEQVLQFEHPLVKVVNLPSRCLNLGEKRNEVARHATCDLIITWGDDDIHLPGRISENVAKHAHGKYDVEGSYFFDCAPNFSKKNSGLCGPFLMSREEFWGLGGIPSEDVGEDQSFLKLVRKSMAIVPTTKTTFVYRWNTGRYHISGHGFNNNAWEKVGASVQSMVSQGKEPRGEITLRPHWKEDYVAKSVKCLEESV